MTLIVFVGPTLRREEVVADDVVCLPPVAQGDVYRAAQRRPRAIGIIDGYFSGAPSVWHKEILWALSEGIAVFGSASMGALRAAELHGFGMQGVGRIFEAFRDGVLEDDDEVAVIHGPAEAGFVPLAEPMVNIRATLDSAEGGGVLSAPSRRALEAFAKSLFFPRRSWSALLEAAGALGVPQDETEALARWLPQGRIDQKRADALAMLAAMRRSAGDAAAPRPRFRFERTHFWEEMAARPMDDLPADEFGPVSDDRIIDELRLEGPEAYGRTKMAALLRRLAVGEVGRQGVTIRPEARRDILNRLRASLGLFTRAQLDGWLARNHLDAASLDRLIEDQACSETLAALADPAFRRHLLDELRFAGTYERLAERAGKKRSVLAAQAVEGIGPGASGPGVVQRRLWFFERRLGQALPDDIEGFARELGYANLDDFDSAVNREWLYSKPECE